MAQFAFPVKLNRFTTEEFDKQKSAYVAKYGYTINVPGFRDVIKLGLERPPTEEELSKYSSRDPGELSVRRWNEIKAIKMKKKEAFQRMMASPQSAWFQNIGTAMTFLDDVNDTLGTCAMLARFSAMLFPKLLGRVLLGPAGWMLLGADIANVGMVLSRAPVSMLTRKGRMATATGMNPFCKKAKVARAKKLRMIRPSKGQIIEAMQTTDNVFGVGLCLGPIMGLAYDIGWGLYRSVTGKKVTVKHPPRMLATHEQLGMNMLKVAQQLWTGGQELSEDDHTKVILATNAATQVLYPVIKQWHPVDEISDINDIEIQAPGPKDPTTLELFKEEGVDPQKHIGFLSTGEEYSTPMDLWDSAEPLINTSFHEYCERNKHNYMGQMGGWTATDTVQNLYSLMEGEDEVRLDYSHTEKAIFKMFDNGYKFAFTTAPEQLKCFSEKVEFYGERGTDYSWRDLMDRLRRYCGINFA